MHKDTNMFSLTKSPILEEGLWCIWGECKCSFGVRSAISKCPSSYQKKGWLKLIKIKIQFVIKRVYLLKTFPEQQLQPAMSSTAARLLAAARQQILYFCFLCWKTGLAANHLAHSTHPQTSQHHMTFKQDLWSPPNHHQPPPPSIKSTFLFLHFTAMPIVNPALPGKAPSSSLPPLLFCDVQWNPP